MCSTARSRRWARWAAVAPGAALSREDVLWAGPKAQKTMAAVHPTLDLSVDYGILSFLAQPLFWLLSVLHGLLGNWGWAIIAIVIREQAVCKGKAPCFGAFADVPDGCERGCLPGSHVWKCFAKCQHGRCLVLDVPRRVVQDEFGRTGCREFSIRKCQNLTPSLASAL